MIIAILLIVLSNTAAYLLGYRRGYKAAQDIWAHFVASGKPAETKIKLRRKDGQPVSGKVVKADRPPAYGEKGRVVRAEPKILRVMTKDDK